VAFEAIEVLLLVGTLRMEVGYCGVTIVGGGGGGKDGAGNEVLRRREDGREPERTSCARDDTGGELPWRRKFGGSPSLEANRFGDLRVGVGIDRDLR